MRIACVTNTPQDRALGSGKTVLSWSEGLRQLGHSVDVFSPETFYRPLKGHIVRRLKLRWDALSLAGLLQSRKYDLIEFYGGEFGWLIGRLSTRDSKTLLVAHTNGLELLAAEAAPAFPHFSLSRLVKWPVNKLISNCDYLAFSKPHRFAAICSMDADYIVSRRIQPKEHTIVVEPGIDDEFLQSNWNSSRDHLIAYLGTWSERKDPETLVMVISNLLKHDLTLNAELIGCSAERGMILSSFPSTLRSRILVHDRIEKAAIVQVLERAKLLLFPSLYEGFGMATAEAMACGCAVVVTPTGFGGSLINGENALVRPFRDANGFVEAAKMLLENPSFRDRIAYAGRDRVKGMAWKNQVAVLERAYRAWHDEFTSQWPNGLQ
jgi:glycosyltransferase involved in cell wall biosynthesis